MTVDLPALLKKKQDLEARTQRIKGRLEEAKRNLSAIEQECETKNINPANLDSSISDLQVEIKETYSTLKGQMESIDQELRTYEDA